MSEVLHIYTRVSTLVQADEGMSLDIQRDIGMERASQLGFEAKLWNEGGKSSNHEEIDKRPILSQLLAEIQKGAVKHLFVYDQSRLSRNDYVSSIFRYECNKHGVTLYNKEGKYDLSNPQDQFLKQILDAVGQFDNAQRAERTRLGKIARIRQGNWMGGPPPYGYAIQERKLVINDDEAKWVRTIFERYAAKVPSIDIKLELDRNGVEPRRKKGTWTLGSLQALLRNTHYVGYWEYKDSKTGEQIRVDCPRILSVDLWNRVKATREKNQKNRRSDNPTKHFYMLKHVLRCGHCGSWLSGIYSDKQTKNHYYCPKKERVWSKRPPSETEKWQRGRVCTMTRSLNIDEADALVWDSVINAISKSVLMKDAVRKEVLGDGGATLQVSAKEEKSRIAKIKTLMKHIERLDESLTELESDRLMGKITQSQYPNIKSRISDEKLQTEGELERLVELTNAAKQKKNWIDWIDKFQRKVDAYRSFSPEEKREVLQGLLTEIDVHLVDAKKHRLDIKFKLPLVDDKLVYKDPSNKSLGYKVKEGSATLKVDLVSRPYSKKKPLTPMG